MKKMTKALSVLLMAMFIVSFATTAFAVSPVNPNFIDTQTANVNTSGIKTFGANILSIVSTVGSVASVIVLVVLGIKYMMGSAEEKAEYKKTLLPYLVGAILIFAASTIATIVFNFASSING